MPAVRVRTALVAALGCGACTGQPQAQPVATLSVDIPGGFDVLVDSTRRGATPISRLELDAGQHDVSLQTPCGEMKSTVNVAVGTDTRIEASHFEGFALASLTINAKTNTGEPVTPQVTLGEWTATRGSDGVYPVPACKHRMRVQGSDPGLGAYVEDVEIEPGQALARSMVLAPGPDMVRIAGGRFTMGPTARQKQQWEDVLSVANSEKHVKTFDLDRTEVTAAQFFACTAAGECPFDLEKAIGISMPHERVVAKCTFWRDVVRNKFIPRVASARGDHPVNCVTEWEARAYCAWAGKRLPTDVEWEFAAKSRTSDYDYPWGNDRPAACPIRAFSVELHCPGYEQTAAVCSQPAGNSEQGLCDLQGNVCEYVDAAGGGTVDRCKGSEFSDWLDSFRLRVAGPNDKSVSVGFRCARSVN